MLQYSVARMAGNEQSLRHPTMVESVALLFSHSNQLLTGCTIPQPHVGRGYQTLLPQAVKVGGVCLCAILPLYLSCPIQPLLVLCTSPHSRRFTFTGTPYRLKYYSNNHRIWISSAENLANSSRCSFRTAKPITSQGSVSLVHTTTITSDLNDFHLRSTQHGALPESVTRGEVRNVPGSSKILARCCS
jgi:hypothetical protein